MTGWSAYYNDFEKSEWEYFLSKQKICSIKDEKVEDEKEVNLLCVLLN